MSTTIHVLLVEDDVRLAAFVRDYLTEKQFTVEHAADAETALRQFRLRTFDAVLLDVMLPRMNGFTLCRSLRELSDVPILLVTARSEESDRVLGLELGADDYVVKPYSPRELAARLTAFVRRHRGDLGHRGIELRSGGLAANTATFVATLDEVPLPLSPTEFQLLVKFMERPGRVLTRERLLELMSGSSDDAFDRAVDVQVSRLRNKLGNSKRGHGLIRTIRGVGYMLVADGGES